MIEFMNANIDEMAYLIAALQEHRVKFSIDRVGDVYRLTIQS